MSGPKKAKSPRHWRQAGMMVDYPIFAARGNDLTLLYERVSFRLLFLIVVGLSLMLPILNASKPHQNQSPSFCCCLTLSPLCVPLRRPCSCAFWFLFQLIWWRMASKRSRGSWSCILQSSKEEMECFCKFQSHLFSFMNQLWFLLFYEPEISFKQLTTWWQILVELLQPAPLSLLFILSWKQ